MIKMLRRVEAIREGEKIRDYVAVERELRLVVNDKPIAVVKLSPGYEEEFALGYCLGEGLIKDPEEVRRVRLVENTLEVKADASFDLAYETYLLSDCISGWRARIEAEKVRVASAFKVKARELMENMRELRRRSRVWLKTGGVHAVALVSGDSFLVVEDISRHIALDKVIGLGAKQGVGFGESYILTSGRLPGDMVIKAARVNIPIVASRTAPITSGIECAQETELTLVAFLRGRRMNIYTHPERIIP